MASFSYKVDKTKDSVVIQETATETIIKKISGRSFLHDAEKEFLKKLRNGTIGFRGWTPNFLSN